MLGDLWDIVSARTVLTLRTPKKSPCFALFSPDGNSLLFASREGGGPGHFIQVLQPGTLAEIDATIPR